MTVSDRSVLAPDFVLCPSDDDVTSDENVASLVGGTQQVVLRREIDTVNRVSIARARRLRGGRCGRLQGFVRLCLSGLSISHSASTDRLIVLPGFEILRDRDSGLTPASGLPGPGQQSMASWPWRECLSGISHWPPRAGIFPATFPVPLKETADQTQCHAGSSVRVQPGLRYGPLSTRCRRLRQCAA